MVDGREYSCCVCKFTTTRRNDYARHIKTRKHSNKVYLFLNPQLTMGGQGKLYCACGRAYTHRSGLSRHRAMCSAYLNMKLDCYVCSDDENDDEVPEEVPEEVADDIVDDNADDTTDIVADSDEGPSATPTVPTARVERDHPQTSTSGVSGFANPFGVSTEEVTFLLSDIAQQLREMKQTQLVQQQQITNNNNYVLNMNMFLNEKCKDALSVQEFLKQMTFVFDDLKDRTWRSKVLLNNLGSLQLENRPFHCLDTSTFQVVLKNDGGWQEGNKDDIVSTLDNCGKHVQKNFGPQWESQHPNWMTSDRYSKQYMSLWSNITREPSQDQVDEELKRVSSSTALGKDNGAMLVGGTNSSLA